MPEYMSDDFANHITENDLYDNHHNIVVPKWAENLKKHGVKKPPKWGSSGAAQLALLAYQKICSKKQVKATLERLGYESNDLQKVRHLGSQDGYYVCQSTRLEKEEGIKAKRGEYWLKTLEDPLPGYNPNRRSKNGTLANDKLCTHCCRGVGDVHPKYGGDIIKSVGWYHADPRLPLSDENKVLQCDVCNRTLKDHYVFRPEDGDVKEVLKPR